MLGTFLRNVVFKKSSGEKACHNNTALLDACVQLFIYPV